MDFEQIQTFIDAAELSSFSLVAQKRFITQPAVSKRIAMLEEELDTKLFDRIKRQVILTPAGQEFLAYAKRIIALTNQAAEAVASTRHRVSGELRIGSSHHVGLHQLPPYLERFQKRLKALEHPGLWNGAMAGWNTVFVEVPITTFSPVKTVHDLLRKEHREL